MSTIWEFSPNLNLPYVLGNQAQKHVTVNEGLRALDALVQMSVQGVDFTSPPTDPEEGQCFLLSAEPTGVWANQAGKIAAFQDGGWIFYTPKAGFQVFNDAAMEPLVFDGAAWVTPYGSMLSDLTAIGIGGAADSNNPLLVKANTSLFTALRVADGGNGDVQWKIEKETASDTASILFQAGFSGRAEIGLVGDDDLVFKVSPDGSTFHESLRLNKDTGRATFPNGGVREQLDSNRVYYVDALSGSDAHNGLSSGTPFATIQHAIDTVLGLDLGISNVTISIADGTYNELVTISGTIVGSGALTLTGSPDAPENCVISSTSHVLIVSEGAKVAVQGLSFESTGAGSRYGLMALNGGRINITGNCVIGPVPGAHFFAADPGSSIEISSDVTISGDPFRCFYVLDGASVVASSETLSIDGGSGAFTTFCDVRRGSMAILTGLTFVGTATGKRYNATELSLIATNGGGASYFPGSTSGSTATGAQYT